MSKLIKIEAPELLQIEKTKAEAIRKVFEPMAAMLDDFENRYNAVITEAEKEITNDVCGKAKRIRLDIAKVRIATEKARKEEKEIYLRAGKAVDGVANILKWAVGEKEQKLKDIENYFERIEKERLEKLQQKRVEELSAYVADAEERELNSMDEEVWNAYLGAKKKEYEDRIKAERKAEAERIAKEKAEAEEAERIRKENEKLRKEAEEAERKRQEELSRGDTENMQCLIEDLKSITCKYKFKSKENQEKLQKITTEIQKIIASI